ncbi:BREX-2 system adenine-specific DNA-methyltransferase PglX [Actinopolymorpha sp. B17G11]|uniref:BREX-2 system adenine-specific DNA-methyltransferase PglX n=1 Tax=Actinopolymorpha sp. B17G11 TaxID=3160861 RepID=UPI0032E4280F
MIDAKRLLADLREQVRLVEVDLLRIVDQDAGAASRLRLRYQAASSGSRTGLPFETWRGQQVTQVAAGWVLACVFTRFCEDNRLLEQAMLAGPSERLVEARERQNAYFGDNPADSDLDYLRTAVFRLMDSEVTRALVDKQNPLHLLEPSPDVATQLLDFWRRIDPETGALVHDFTDPELSTRFLGDLYQDLSEQARKDYALLQTPEFVEEFILDRTLDPAVEEFGLADVRMIDPACGSGHFVLGAFARLLRRWRQVEPGVDVRVHVERVLRQVNGVDINPYAAAIARFRLLVAALTSCGIERLKDAPNWRVRVAIGDSLLFGVRHGQAALDGVTEAVMAGQCGEGEFVYEYEDAAELEDILGDRYHAVVANPPYITVKDPLLNGLYRKAWSACAGRYALSVPFAQRLFDLAQPGGFTGQITANSFMTREFGKRLIEEFFPMVDLTAVIDTSRAFIPGHATSTVILFGRNRRPNRMSLLAVMGVRGESTEPTNPASGRVWRSILNEISRGPTDNDYVSLVDLPRVHLSSHPWSLAGGGASALTNTVEQSAAGLLAARIVGSIGFASFPGIDDVYILPRDCGKRHRLPCSLLRPLVAGEVVRDWSLSMSDIALAPYTNLQEAMDLDSSSSWAQYLWPYKVTLENVRGFSGETRSEAGEPWWTWYRWISERYDGGLSGVFAEVATHNHFVIDRGCNVFKQTAPMFKLRGNPSEEDYLGVIGLLNSSTGNFWITQKCHDKGSGGNGRGLATEQWEHMYQRAGTRVSQFPLPEGAPLALAAKLNSLASDLQSVTPGAVAENGVPTREALAAARFEWSQIRAEMISAQEELDWEVYGLYGLLGENVGLLVGENISKPPIQLGERAFEIALTRQVDTGDVATQWFARHGSTPITELPAHWSADYRALVERRLVKIAEDPHLHLIERPECKRRWAAKSWEEMESEALRSWLLDRLEDRAPWFRPHPTLRTVAQLADELRADVDFVSVAQLYARDKDLVDVVRDLVRDQHVPGVAAWRHTDTGMWTRAAWERTWDLQRREDAGEKVGEIPVPPKYKQGDFRDQSYWRKRGKLDVPKERFTSYPDASRDGTLLLSWAGFDHLQQAQALATYISERVELDAWGVEQLTPLMAGLAELLPWIRQWHTEVDPEFGERPADAYGRFLEELLLQLGLTRNDLYVWRPPSPTRGRRRRTTT